MTTTGARLREPLAAASAAALTNQAVINIFARAAETLGSADPWELLGRAGLNLAVLASDRNAPYAGPPLGELPNVSETERAALLDALERLTATAPSPAPATGFLRGDQELRSAPLAPPPDDTAHGSPPGAGWMATVLVETWNRYGGLLTLIGRRLGIDPALAAAVLAVESGGRAFDARGRLLIRFEVHVFWDKWGQQNAEKFARHFRFDPAVPWQGDGHAWRPDPNEQWRPVHAGQDGEWEAFGFARVLCSDRAAKLSISMGAPQIMGFNHAQIGYPDVEAMFDAFENDERAQILGLFDFIKGDGRMVDALAQGDVVRFASIYNGTGQAELYAGRMREGLAALAAVRPLPPPIAPALPRPAAAEMPAPAYVERPQTRPQPAAVSQAIPVPGQLPVPPSGAEAASLQQLDPQLYEYWREHVRNGFEQNTEMFDRILDAFMEPYYTTVWMYRVLFGVGVLSFIAAVVLSIWLQQPLYGLVFGGLSAAAFISYFFNRPLQALEENLHFITWLGVIYNSYWTRLAYMFDARTVQTDLRKATEDAINDLDRLLDKHALLSGKRPQPTGGAPAAPPGEAEPGGGNG
jgi:hypothetical protein